MAEPRDHGGRLDAAMAEWGGTRGDWIDLSTGINPVAYPLPELAASTWTDLPDREAETALTDAARRFWTVPDAARIVAAPGASALIAALPGLLPPGPVRIPAPTYNEHAAAFAAHGHAPASDGPAPVQVLVHPNNPDGRLWRDPPQADLTIVDESFCDVTSGDSLVARTARPGTVVLKSFGKFWGLAGLRLGFAIAHPDTLPNLAQRLGPWAASGPALAVGRVALRDTDWAAATRDRLARDAVRLDEALEGAGARIAGGTDLFRLYEVDDARDWHARLARHRILSRIFPYSDRWLRLGIPPPGQFDRIDAALRAG